MVMCNSWTPLLVSDCWQLSSTMALPWLLSTLCKLIRKPRSTSLPLVGYQSMQTVAHGNENPHSAQYFTHKFQASLISMLSNQLLDLPALLSPESFIMWVMNAYLPSWCMCDIINFHILDQIWGKNQSFLCKKIWNIRLVSGIYNEHSEFNNKKMPNKNGQKI